MAVNWDDYDKSRYFNGKNFEGQQVVTITHVMEETIGKGADAEPKVVVYVGEDPRGLILNVSRRESLRALFGDNTDEWDGKQFLLVAGRALFQGRSVPSLQVQAVPPRPGASASRSFGQQPRA